MLSLFMQGNTHLIRLTRDLYVYGLRFLLVLLSVLYLSIVLFSLSLGFVFVSQLLLFFLFLVLHFDLLGFRW